MNTHSPEPVDQETLSPAMRRYSKPTLFQEAREYRLFRALDQECREFVHKGDIQQELLRAGLSLDDGRLRESKQALKGVGANEPIHFKDFCQYIRPNILLIERAIQGQLVIPDFQDFCGEITRIYQLTDHFSGGQVAQYIPQLARVDPEQYAVAVCSVDGQQFEIGDSDVDFCIQSCCKPIIYSLALEEHGAEEVHRYVGREPSGQGFNELTLNKEKKPHNPMINAGAIMSCSLIAKGMPISDRFEYVMDRIKALSGGQKASFSNSVYLSERQTADRNFALGYFMREHKAFPENTQLVEVLEFYFQCCSIEMNAQSMAVVAATLANGGVCPTSGERVLSVKNVQHCLSLMYSCGMYDFSGEFAFSVGLPAKSGVAGALMIVVPNVMGLCTWSPRLDDLGNSVRGLEFCRSLVQTFNVHNYDHLANTADKKDPRKSRLQAKASQVNALLLAASKGDIGAVQTMSVRGIDLELADYDHRTALHLAATEGHVAMIKLFLKLGLNVNPRDRWGRSPVDDACRHGHHEVQELLLAHGGQAYLTEACGLSDAPLISSFIHSQMNIENILELIWAASEGELIEIQRLVARGTSLEGSDYDQRTALHLAASEGHEDLVRYFIRQGVKLDPRDRFGGTPIDDARREGHKDIELMLEAALKAVSEG